jgi:hypothetical protein
LRVANISQPPLRIFGETPLQQAAAFVAEACAGDDEQASTRASRWNE